MENEAEIVTNNRLDAIEDAIIGIINYLEDRADKQELKILHDIHIDFMDSKKYKV